MLFSFAADLGMVGVSKLNLNPMKPQKIPRRPRQRILLINNKCAGNKQIVIRKMFHCQILNMLKRSFRDMIERRYEDVSN